MQIKRNCCCVVRMLPLRLANCVHVHCRLCLGRTMALLQLKCFVTHLFDAFDFTIDEQHQQNIDEFGDPLYRMSLILWIKDGLWVHASPRQSWACFERKRMYLTEKTHNFQLIMMAVDVHAPNAIWSWIFRKCSTKPITLFSACAENVADFKYKRPHTPTNVQYLKQMYSRRKNTLDPSQSKYVVHRYYLSFDKRYVVTFRHLESSARTSPESSAKISELP